MSKNVRRLFTQFQPKHYIVELVPNRTDKTFKGTVSVHGQKVGRPTQRLTLHQSALKITKATVIKQDKQGETAIPVDRINHHASFDEVRLHTEQMIYPGSYTVELEFEGVISPQMNGMYPCHFEQNGQAKELIATQFESHHAREVFPCIDEPEAKATFDLILTTPKSEAVIANTPIKKQKTVGDQTVTSFETTPHMSTYLLAFVYGELEYKEATTRDGVVIRTYATPDNVGFTDFALDTAVKCLEFYNEYFGIPYPLEKCDLIALPDFASGAMENWGCITFREQCMLVDPKNTSLGNKQYVAMVVAHELAHQWFGNLVTMRWWTDLWLNEGFASWVEYLAIDHIFPEWQMWTQFAVDEQQRAFKLDALENTHPIEVAVRHPDEIRTIFDTISYSKGASVIHMLHEYLRPEQFRDGLRHYLQTHAYGNTDTVDLWQSLEEISGKPVKAFMHAWTSQPGFPLVSATIDNKEVKLTQQRFYVNPQHSKDKNLTWPIALLSTNPEIPEVFNGEADELQVSDTVHIKLNQGQSGFYRTAYNSSHIERLGEKITKSQLSPLDRLGILSDLFETAKAGYIDTTSALHFLELFADENDNAVWDVIAGSLGSVRLVMDDDKIRQAMKPFVRKLVAKQLARLGWEAQKGESHFDSLLRPTILSLAAAADEKTVVTESLRRFETMKHAHDIEPDIRGVIYATAVRHGDVKTFDKLFAMHEASTLSEERTTLAAALTSFEQPELTARALSLINSPSVRLQDVSYWVAYSFMNRHAKRETWKWMTKNWDWLGENLGTDLSYYRFPMYAANVFSDEAFLKEFKDFFIPRKNPSFERSIKQGIEVIEWQSAWKARDHKEILNFFNHRSDQ